MSSVPPPDVDPLARVSVESGREWVDRAPAPCWWLPPLANDVWPE